MALWFGKKYAAGAGRPETTKPPDGGLSFNHCFGIREILERAKGLEPSTPTLARSCSTTELHPHPRWQRTLAVNGRPMPNADRECNSPHAVECRADNPVSSTMAANRTEITPKRGLSAAPVHAGSPAARHRRNAGRFDPFFPYQPPNDG